MLAFAASNDYFRLFIPLGVRNVVNPTRKKAILVLVIIISVSLWVASEVYYARSMSPSGVHTVADHYRRFGEPGRITRFERDGVAYYELSGISRRFPTLALALPSAPPAYIYDESGKFVEWCSDPGDQPDFRGRWPVTGGQLVDPSTFRHRYGL